MDKKIIKLAPSILAADFSNLTKDLAKIKKAHYLHFDVMDGNFVPNISFGVPVLDSIRRETDLLFDVHLMVADPTRHIEAFAEAGADIINIHREVYDSVLALRKSLTQIRTLGKKPALTVNPETPIEAILPLVEEVAMVLIMSVEPGYGGQVFLPDTLAKAEQLANFIQRKGLSTEIEMDGGITLSNLQYVLRAGVNVVVAGSAIFSGNVAGNVDEFLECFEKTRWVGI